MWTVLLSPRYLIPDITFIYAEVGMKKRVITIELETDAPDAVLEEIAEHMRWQLDSMCDGTLDMETEGQPDIIDETYIVTKVKVV